MKTCRRSSRSSCIARFCHADVVMASIGGTGGWSTGAPPPDCPWGGGGLPFYIVDYEIFRFLPTVVVGTLDKAALISFQSAMREC